MMVEFCNIGKSFENPYTPVFNGLSFRVEPGEFVLVTGESGVGKSTLIRLILRELLPEEGKIYVQEQDIGLINDKNIPAYRRKLGVVFQDFRIIPSKTVYENVDIARISTGGQRDGAVIRINSILKMLGIEGLFNRHPKELSGGELQKVCLARALVNSPIILLADEPTGNLDPRSAGEIMELFHMLHKRGMTVIVATHDLEAAKGLSYREICLDPK